ncbi:MAG: metallophosphoesterase family protein [Acidimicrobiales bacterium]
MQLSDTHFLERGLEAEGGGAYDTSLAFEHVLEHLGDHDHYDFVAVTGDIADHGRPAQYELAAAALRRLQADVKVCPGNHDADEALRAHLDGADISMPRVVELGAWAFLFVDSNAGVMEPDDSGRLVDPPGDARLHNDGVLADAEADWVRDACSRTAADHVFIWVHHPPSHDLPALSRNAPYTEAWRALLADLPAVRGLGGGHTHVPAEYDLDGRPVIVAPSFKNNFDLEAAIWLPPGYRTYAFAPDGSVTSEVHLLEHHDEHWPQRRMGRAIKALFAGELTHAELAEIAARRHGDR